MSYFESDKVKVDENPSQVFRFLNNAANLYELLPQERIEDWKADADSCSFRISGLSSLSLQRQESGSEDRIDYQAGDKAPFPFILRIHLAGNGEGTDCQVTCEAELNPVMEQMTQDPLNRLFNHMAERIKELDLGTEAP
ncbi:MAG: hypothetical protein ABEH38_03195 [Flavobacteriales bacterium]